MFKKVKSFLVPTVQKKVSKPELSHSSCQNLFERKYYVEGDDEMCVVGTKLFVSNVQMNFRDS